MCALARFLSNIEHGRTESQRVKSLSEGDGSMIIGIQSTRILFLDHARGKGIMWFPKAHDRRFALPHCFLQSASTLQSQKSEING